MIPNVKLLVEYFQILKYQAACQARRGAGHQPRIGSQQSSIVMNSKYVQIMSNLFICKHNGLAAQTPTLARLLPSHLPPLSSFPALWLVLVSPYSPLIGLTTDTFQDSWHQSVREDWSALVFSPDFISWRFAMSWHVELTRRQYTHVWLGEKVCFKDESWIKINWQPRLSKNNHVWEYCDRNTDDLVLTLAWSNKSRTQLRRMRQCCNLSVLTFPQ